MYRDTELQKGMTVICPKCRRQNRVLNRGIGATYWCCNCRHLFLNQSKSSGGNLSDLRIIYYIFIFGFVAFLCLNRCTRDRSPSLPTPPFSSIYSPSSPLESIPMGPMNEVDASVKSVKISPSKTPVSESKSRKSGGRTDDFGHPFPAKSGYLKGYKALKIGGYSSVTVDNSQNDSDVFVKLFTLDSKPPKAASVFFIQANDKFTVEDIQPGNYDVRYRDLSSRELAQTEQFNLKEIRTGNGIKFSKITLTLYKVAHGNMHTQPLSEDEF
jgi:hypothetical protein